MIDDRPVQGRWLRGPLDAAGLFLVFYAGMNLSGVVELTMQVSGGLSVLVLACSLFVIVGSINAQLLAPAYVWFLIFLILFLIGGLVPLISGGDFDVPRLVQYLGTIIYCSALYFFIMQRGRFGFDFVLACLQCAFMIDCIAAVNSNLLSNYLGYTGSTERAMGFFDNPNETATMALYWIVLVVTTGSSAKLTTILKLALALFTLLITFSKSGYLLLFVLGLTYLALRRLYGVALVMLASAIVLIPLIGTIVQSSLDLTVEQQLRIDQFANIFAGDIDDNTTTGRLSLWSLGLQRIGETFPFGGGLGSFHRMDGGYTDLAGDWLGVHNVFLMILGESGLVPLLAFVFFLFVLGKHGVDSSRWMTAVGLFIILIGDMLVGHGTLILRLNNLMLVLLMVMSSGTVEIEADRLPGRKGAMEMRA